MLGSSEDQQIELNVQGMTWMGWEPKVMHALEELPGVRRASASHPGKVAIVLYDPGSVTIEQMRQALFKAGYVASPKATNRTTQIVNHDESNETTDHRADDFVCYCFEYTRGDIEQDLTKNGRSLIIEKIAAEKRTGGCDCTNKNPKGKWCLPDVRRVVDEIMEKLTKSLWLLGQGHHWLLFLLLKPQYLVYGSFGLQPTILLLFTLILSLISRIR